MPMEMRTVSLTKTGFRIEFTKPVERSAAEQPGNYKLQHWGYLYQAEYGSPKVGLTELQPTSVKVSSDGLSVELELPLVKEQVYQLTLSNISGTDGSPITNANGYYTLNRLRE
jgi:hypothetical protein